MIYKSFEESKTEDKAMMKKALFADVVRILNVHTEIINYLAAVVESQENQIKILEKLAERREENGK